jgi:hypothetical protein
MTKDNMDKYQKDIEKEISLGVSEDNVSIRTVSFWMVLGIVMVTIILFGLYNMYNYNQFLSSQQAAIDAEFHELKQRKEREHRMLNTVELVDEENRRYRIPIDSAMTLIARE